VGHPTLSLLAERRSLMASGSSFAAAAEYAELANRLANVARFSSDADKVHADAIGWALCSLFATLAALPQHWAPPLKCPKCGNEEHFSYRQEFVYLQPILAARSDGVGFVTIHVEDEDVRADDMDRTDTGVMCDECDSAIRVQFEISRRGIQLRAARGKSDPGTAVYVE
jgi:hypothetical protein